MAFFSEPLAANPTYEEASRPLPRVMPAHRRQRIVVLSSYSPSLTNFRLELLKRMVDAGHIVTAVGPEDDARTRVALSRIGVDFAHVPMARVGLNPITDLVTLWSLWRLLRKLKPNMVVPYTMKPIIYGGIAARFAGVRSRCFLVTGLGHIFSSNGAATLKGRVVKQISVLLYRCAFAGANVVFAYNEADAADIREHRMVKDESLIRIVPGSGVDLEHYAFAPPPSDRPVFLLVARLLKDKGILEYIEAARRVRRLYPKAEFQLLGHFDPNPASGISSADIQKWVDEGILTFLGETRDVRPYLARCNVFVLPTYYREGIPRSILEAMSVGRAIITTNLAGCSDTVQPGVNGCLVEPRSVDDLARAMSELAGNLPLAEDMGRKSRELAQAKFDVHLVNEILIERMALASP
ncbi:glycosyltransferase family 4 protein [Pararhizobium sp. YC-54]|uniref:glycosyltransferase family 4 protein n=1 Tax=Pararhizobium sp. YC-54 TaxID=2986920 RepID=UPI00299EAAA7|nr:glycosyltransferase family 4 protein [Pararhizobium sp. YC-54]